LPGDVTREEAVLAYRMMLGREPESEEVIAHAISAAPDVATLGRHFAASPEFGRRHGINQHAAPRFDAPPLEIETEATPEELARLTEHLARYWTRMGVDAPHWSVVTQERFRPENIGANLAEFYEGGAWDGAVLDATLARIGRRAEEFAHAVDYGCGVGRITVHLARRFAVVTGLDISAPHLELAAAAVKEGGHANVTLQRVTAADLMPVPRCDLWFSRIVLQHDPPPIAFEVLRRTFASLAPRGVAVFQIPTWCEGYRFRIAEYLAWRPGAEMELHVVPQRAVLELAHRSGLILREIREDNYITGEPGRVVSNTFVFEKI
jgi:SAM-dependent methyltransferase